MEETAQRGEGEKKDGARQQFEQADGDVAMKKKHREKEDLAEEGDWQQKRQLKSERNLNQERLGMQKRKKGIQEAE